MYIILFITHRRYNSLAHLKTTATEIQGIKITKKNETRTCFPEKFIVNLGFASVENEFLGATICSITLSAMCYLYNAI